MSDAARMIWKGIGIGITAALLLAAVIWGYQMRPTDEPCVSLTYIIEDKAERLYLTEEELNQLLRSEDLFPIGRRLDLLSLHRIEQAVSHHPMVRTAECYLTPRNEMKIRLTQRVPLLHVQVPGDAYFIDTDRRVMEARVAVQDTVLLAKGAVGVQVASTQLADFAEWLQRNAYWRERVEYIRLQSPQMAHLYLRGENQPRIVLGNMHGYERKLHKLRTFLDNGAEALQDKQYTEYDVRYKGQVIGRK